MSNSALFLAVMFMMMASCSVERPVEKDAEVVDFRVGQVWKYQTRIGEETSRLVICKVDSSENLGPIIHIQVNGLAMNNPASPTGIGHLIGHMPIAQDNLRESVVTLDEIRQQLPDFETGYNSWRQAFDNGNAGIFTDSVADSVEFVEQTLNP